MLLPCWARFFFQQICDSFPTKKTITVGRNIDKKQSKVNQQIDATRSRFFYNFGRVVKSNVSSSGNPKKIFWSNLCGFSKLTVYIYVYVSYIFHLESNSLNYDLMFCILYFTLYVLYTYICLYYIASSLCFVPHFNSKF